MLPRDAGAQREQLVRRLAAKRLLDRHHEPGPAVHPRVRPGRLPRPGARRRRAAGDARTSSRARSTAATWNDKLVAVPFWANTQLLWYRKSVAEAAGLDMTQPVTWDQLIEAPPRTRTSCSACRAPRGVADRVVQRAHRVRRRDDHRENSDRARQDRAGARHPGRAKRAAEVMRDVGKQRRRRARPADRSEDTIATVFEGDKGVVHGQLAVRLAARAGRRQGRHARPVGARRLRLGAVPAGGRGQAERRRPTAGSTSASAAFSKHIDLAYEASGVHRHRREPGLVLRDQRQPGRRTPTVYDDPEVQGGLPDGRRSSGSRWSWPRRGRRRRTTARSPAACSRSPPAGSVDPDDDAAGGDRPDHRRAPRGAAAVSTTTLPPERKTAHRLGAAAAADQRPRQGRAPAGLAAGRPGVRGHAAGHGLPDPAGGLRLAVQLPAHRPGQPVVHRAEQLLRHPHRRALVAGARRHACSSRWSRSWSSWCSGFALALVMPKALKRSRPVLRAAILIPYAVITVVSAFAWCLRLQHQLGLRQQLVRLGARHRRGHRLVRPAVDPPVRHHACRDLEDHAVHLAAAAGRPRPGARRAAGGGEGRRRDVVAAAAQGDPAEHEGRDHGGRAVPQPWTRSASSTASSS